MIQLAVMDSTVNLTQLLEKIDRMPEGGSEGAPVTPAPAPRTASAPASGAPAASAAPAAPTVSEPPKGGYASMIRETVARKEEKGRTSVKDLASFPTAAPPAPAQPLMSIASDSDVATLTAPNGAGANGSVAYAMNGVASTLVADGYDEPSMASHQNGVVSLGDLQQRWPEFIRCFDDRKTLATALDTAQVAEVRGNTLRLFVASELNLTLLNRHRKHVNEKLSEFFGTTLHIDCVIGAAPQPLAGESSAAASGPHADHPFIKGIVELLGASPL
jgi:hypothetical protein